VTRGPCKTLLARMFFLLGLASDCLFFSILDSKEDRLKPALLWGEREAAYGFGDYVFLDLNQIGTCPRHSEQCVRGVVL
jgi:hypothetical protein